MAFSFLCNILKRPRRLSSCVQKFPGTVRRQSVTNKTPTISRASKPALLHPRLMAPFQGPCQQYVPCRRGTSPRTTKLTHHRQCQDQSCSAVHQQAALTHIIRHIVTHPSSLDAIRRTLRAGADTSRLWTLNLASAHDSAGLLHGLSR